MTRAELIRRIEELEQHAPPDSAALEHERLEHELQVHQIELETQNRELREAQQLLEASRDRYADLYDFAPVGYVTLDPRGIIREINLTAAGMLGVERTRLVGGPFHPYVARDDLAQFRKHLRSLSLPEPHTATELHLVRKGADPLPVLMRSVRVGGEEGKDRLCRVAITDITTRVQAKMLVEQSRARLAGIVGSAIDAVITIDHKGKILEFNPAAEKTFGYQREEAIGKEMAELIVPPALRDSHRRGLQHFLATGEGPVLDRRIEMTAMRRDGAEFPVELAIVRISDEEPPIFTSFVRDLSERNRAEEALREKEAQLALVTESTPVALTQCSRDRRYVFVNRAYAQIVGLAPEEIMGRPIVEIMGEAAYATILPHVEKVLRGETVDYEEEIPFKRVGPRWLRVAYSPHRNELGEVVGWVASISDITARKRAEEALRENRARFEGIVGSAMDAIISVDASQRIVLFNAAAEKMFCCAAREAIGCSIERFIPDRFRAAHAGHIRRFGETGVSSRAMGHLGAISGLRADGEEFPIEASISQTDAGRQKLFTVILRDVTERTRAEAAATQRARQQAAVADLSHHALAGRDLDRLMNDAVALVAQIIEVEFCKVLELTAAGDQLILRAGVGLRAGCLGRISTTPGREAQAGYTLHAGAPVVVEDLRAETRFHPAAILLEHGAISGVSTALRGRPQPYGILGAFTTQRRTFSGDDVHFFQSIADVLAAAIERRQLEEELLAATGREQRRLGQDLHDGLCQHLSGIEFRNEALARALEDDPAARKEVEKIGALLREGTRQARMLARGLAPVELEKNGLMSALAELAANSAQLYRIECRFVSAQPVLVTNETAATHLYRIAQEAISNAVRHAHAKSITIELRPAEDGAVLSITQRRHAAARGARPGGRHGAADHALPRGVDWGDSAARLDNRG